MAERDVDETDNRDPRTTILVLSNGDTVEVDPIDLFKNMVENCYEEHGNNDTSDLQDIMDFLTKYV